MAFTVKLYLNYAHERFNHLIFNWQCQKQEVICKKYAVKVKAQQKSGIY